jgi:hypothetical protein
MRRIKTLAAGMLLAVMVSMSAQTAMAGTGIIITERSGSRSNTGQPVKAEEGMDSTGIIIVALTNIGIIITELR